MSKRTFDIEITYQMPAESTFKYIEAESEEEALELARQEFYDGLDWYQQGAEIQLIEVVDVMPDEEPSGDD